MNVKFHSSKLIKRHWGIATAVVVVLVAGVVIGVNAVSRQEHVAAALAHTRNASDLKTDLGVNITSNVSDLVYVKSDDGVYLSSKSLTANSNGVCSADHAPLGAYLKIMKSAIQTDDSLAPWWETQDGLTQASKPDANGLVRSIEFGDYYLAYMSPQYACGDSQGVIQQQSSEAAVEAKALSTAQAAQ